MNRLDCSASSGFGFAGRPIARRYIPQSSKGNRSWNGGAGSRFRMSCLVGQPLALGSLRHKRGALHVAVAKPLAGVHAEIELREIPIKMLAINPLVDANDPALEDRKEAFQRVRMNVAARPFELGMI